MSTNYTITLRGPLELEYLLALLDCEEQLDHESRHMPQEDDLRADVIERVKGYKCEELDPRLLMTDGEHDGAGQPK